MKIIFEKIRYKNLLSTGDHFTEIVFNRDKLSLIMGENGHGKSSILCSISFALFGKPYRKINKPQLINSINQKNLLVEIEFSIAKDRYFIRRGMKPNIFEIYKNGNLINQDSKTRDYQQYLEQNILRMSFKSFGQIVVLGSATHVPFMQLSAQNRREVIEDLLDIQIFTKMNLLLKERILQNKNDLQDVKYSIDLQSNKIESAESHNESIRKIKKNHISSIKKKIKEQLEFIDEETKIIKSLQEHVNTLTDDISHKLHVVSRLNELKSLQTDLNKEQQSLIKDEKFYDSHDHCPTCKQNINEEFKQQKTLMRNDRVENIKKQSKEIQEEAEQLTQKYDEIEKVEREIGVKELNINEHKANIKISKNTLNNLSKELEKGEQDVKSVDLSSIRQLKEELQRFESDRERLTIQKNRYGIIASMLKDGGIKSQIIKQYVPVMNTIINEYLSAMNFSINFELDENFNETIRSRHYDEFTYASFSEGEKLRIDLSLLLTWRAISKMRNSMSTNLLIMDEILDGSMDNNGCEEFLKIINTLTNDTNVFIISHKGESIADKFDRVLEFRKVKNFSELYIE